jgi:rsbT co-antagonist protein RsbR
MSTEADLQARIATLEAQLGAVFAAAPVLMFALDARGVITMAQGKLLDSMGITPDQIVGHTAEAFYSDMPDAVALVNRALAGESFTTTAQVGPLCLQITYTPYFDGVLSVAIDLTHWTQAEQAAQQQREFLHKVIDALPVRVFWKDATNLTFLGCNRVLAQDLGMSAPDALIGKTDYDLFKSKQQADLYRADDQAVIDSGRARLHYEEPQQRPDGTTGWLRTSKIPIFDAGGTVTSVLGVYEDITERKLADAERERLQQQVIDAQREALADLSSPIIPIMDNVIVMPLVGSIDSVRSRDIMRALLRGISEHRVKVVILDITGVPMVDSGVADHLNHTIQAARLKGAHTIVTGISDAVAETIIDLGIDWSQVETLTDLQSGLIAALARMGVRLTTSNRTDGGK